MKTKFMHSISGVVLAGIAFTGIAGNAQAEDFNYNYIEGVYENYDSDETDADVGRLYGSYELTQNLNIIGEYANGKHKRPLGESGLDFDETVIGMEYHISIAPKTDLTTNLKYINQNTDLASDADGYGAGIGVRHWLMDKVEVDANVDYKDVDDKDDTRLEVGARYYFNDTISAGVGYSNSEENEDAISGNIRWNFK